MNTGKPTKTPLDYMVIAVSPALIMVLVHSLCFFLVDVFYQGAAIGGVRWVLFWFVLAAVLIARIGVEQGAGQAMGYGLALAFTVLFYLSVVQHTVIFGAILLAIVWFTAHHLTLNCTLIDDDADASGQGLMESFQRLPKLFQKSPAAAKTTGSSPAPPALIQPAKKIKTPRPQTPGAWLIYYSLAALPIFGLGQTLLPAGDLAARHRGLVYLFLYLAAALGLLVTTSFLGLRRYLRQRYLAMPSNIAVSWIKFGVVAAVIVLCLSLFLPRPGAGEAWGTMRYKVDYQLRRASEFAARFNPHGTGSGRSGNESGPNGQPGNNSAPAQSGPNKDKGAGSGDQGDKQPGGKPDANGPTGQEGGTDPGQPEQHLSPSASSIYPWLKGLFWVTVVVALLWLSYRYRNPILIALKNIWEAIRNFFATLFGRSRSTTATQSATVKSTGVAPFNTFKNPFLAGGDQVWPPEKLIVYSYNALQSCIHEQQAQKSLPQTPREFCRQLSLEMPDAADELEHLALLYGHVAYGVSIPASYNPEHLRMLWNKMPLPQKANRN